MELSFIRPLLAVAHLGDIVDQIGDANVGDQMQRRRNGVTNLPRFKADDEGVVERLRLDGLDDSYGREDTFATADRNPLGFAQLVEPGDRDRPPRVCADS